MFHVFIKHSDINDFGLCFWNDMSDPGLFTIAPIG